MAQDQVAAAAQLVREAAQLNQEAAELAPVAAATVLFEVHCRLAPGEGLALVGDREELGGWNLRDALLLDWAPGDTPSADKWTARVQLPLAGPISFKVRGGRRWAGLRAGALPGSRPRVVAQGAGQLGA